MKKIFALAVFEGLLLVGCGGDNSKCESSTSSSSEHQGPGSSESSSCIKTAEKQGDEPKIAYLFNINNSLATFVRCTPGTDGIACAGDSTAIPTINNFAAFVGPDNLVPAKLDAQAEGCYEGELTGDQQAVLSTEGADKCYFEVQQFSGDKTDGKPTTTWHQPLGKSSAVPFSSWFPYLSNTTFKVHRIGDESCMQTVTADGQTSTTKKNAIEANILEGSTTWSGLFSLGFDPTMRDEKSVKGGQEFSVKYQPAVDTAELIAAGASDENIATYFDGHFGDSLLLQIQDERGTKAYCKQPDSLTGEIVVPAAIMNKFDGSTQFSLSRHKLTRLPIGLNSELLIHVYVKQYSHGNDAQGQVLGGGPLSIYVEPASK